MNSAAKKLEQHGESLMPLEYLRSAAERLKCVAHPHRLRIVEILYQGKFSVDEIARLCELSQPATSGHLRLMEGKGVLKSTRSGRMVYYTVADPHLKGIIECVRGRLEDSKKDR